MQRAYLLVLLAVCLLVPHPTQAKWNWRKIGNTALKLAPVILPLLGGKRRGVAMDINGDGVIDYDELERAVGTRATGDEMEHFMALADVDGDGLVTKREMTEFLA